VNKVESDPIRLGRIGSGKIRFIIVTINIRKLPGMNAYIVYVIGIFTGIMIITMSSIGIGCANSNADYKKAHSASRAFLIVALVVGILIILICLGVIAFRMYMTFSPQGRMAAMARGTAKTLVDPRSMGQLLAVPGAAAGMAGALGAGATGAATGAVGAAGQQFANMANFMPQQFGRMY
jgi:heme/copper-type cytochrome/quinol oxidase subunit 2